MSFFNMKNSNIQSVETAKSYWANVCSQIPAAFTSTRELVEAEIDQLRRRSVDRTAGESLSGNQLVDIAMYGWKLSLSPRFLSNFLLEVPQHIYN